ncbi:MAG: hypothetical protein FWD45_07235 [Coriobacteriia bacterium]|nr:hypothetical protein [Coriobacteriia bacterium]
MIRNIRFTRLLLVTVFIIGMFPTTAFASNTGERYGSDLSEYQAILDKLNAEYGTDCRFVSQDDIDRYGYLGIRLPRVEDMGTLSEFEEFHRIELAAAEQRRKEAEEFYAEFADDILSGECGSAEPILNDDGEVIGYGYPSIETDDASRIEEPELTRSTKTGYVPYNLFPVGESAKVYGVTNTTSRPWKWNQVNGRYYYSNSTYPAFMPSTWSQNPPTVNGTQTSLTVTWSGKYYMSIVTIINDTRKGTFVADDMY